MEQLTTKEINLIVEALLFSSCLEVTDEWSNEDREAMIQIANKIKNSDCSLKNIQMHVFNEEKNNISQMICEYFTNIQTTQHISATTE